MALPLTDAASLAAQQINIKPNIVLKIDGLDTLLGGVEILKFIKVGDPGLLVGGGWVIGGLSSIEDQESILQLEGTTTTINQQILPDKGASASVSSIEVQIIDKDGFGTRIITPGELLTDILGSRATLYFGFADTAWPQDYIRIFRGIIDDVTAGPGYIKFNISHPDQKKRQRIFEKAETQLNGALNNSDTTITVDSTAAFITPPSDTAFTTYIRIDDEIIKYTGYSSTQFTGCTRAQLGTIAAAHDDDSSVTSVYRLSDDMIDLALKIMISGRDAPYISSVEVESFVTLGTSGTDNNGIFFQNLNVKEEYNVQVGDTIIVSGATNAGNNVTRLIESVIQTSDGSYVIVDGAALTYETGSPAVCSFTSQYDTLGEGLAMIPDEIDIDEHRKLKTNFFSSFFDYDFQLDDTIEDGKEFIEKEIYFPSACYSLPRKSRASIGFTNPPLATETPKRLTIDTVVNPKDLKLKRTINKYFYNTIVYKYDPRALEQDKFKQGYVRTDTDSTNQISYGTKAFLIESHGIRPSAETSTILEVNSRRLLDRYKFAAQHFQGVKLMFREGFNLEVGDVVLFGDSSLNVVDITQGSRDFIPRLMEVSNRKLNIKTGEILLDLTDTNFLTDGRFGVISPSSKVDSGSTLTRIVLQDNAFGTLSVAREKDKWSDYFGEKIIVHDDSWTSVQECTLTGFDPGNSLVMIVSGLSTPPALDDIVEIPEYPSGTNPRDNALYKAMHVFLNPQVAVTSGTSSTVFNVGAGDISKFSIGCTIIVHNESFSVASGEVKVQNISGTQITVDQSLGFTPSSSELVDLIGYSDGGSPYRYI